MISLTASARLWGYKMLDCRYYDLCCFTDDSCNGEPECPKRNHCQFYSPMPNIKALTGLSYELDAEKNFILVGGYGRRIREALGVIRDEK